MIRVWRAAAIALPPEHVSSDSPAAAGAFVRDVTDLIGVEALGSAEFGGIRVDLEPALRCVLRLRSGGFTLCPL